MKNNKGLKALLSTYLGNVFYLLFITFLFSDILLHCRLQKGICYKIIEMKLNLLTNKIIKYIISKKHDICYSNNILKEVIL